MGEENMIFKADKTFPMFQIWAAFPNSPEDFHYLISEKFSNIAL